MARMISKAHRHNNGCRAEKKLGIPYCCRDFGNRGDAIRSVQRAYEKLEWHHEVEDEIYGEDDGCSD